MIKIINGKKAYRYPEKCKTWAQNNREKVRENARLNARKRLDTIWAYSIKRKFKITVKQYEEMCERQQRCCAICGKHEKDNLRRLSVDHNHTTGKIRELLCLTCNTALGYVERQAFVELATKYLDKHKEETNMPMAKKANTTTNAPVAATPSVGQAVEPAKAVNPPANYGTPKLNKKDASYYVMNGYGKPMSQYEIDRDQRISKAGIIQSVVQSPGLATVPFKTRTDFVKLVKETAQELLDWVNEGI